MSHGRSNGFSILIVPDDGSPTREFKISAPLLRALIVVLGFGLVVTLIGTLAIWRLRTWTSNVERLETENAGLRAKAQMVEALSRELDRLKLTDQQIRTMLSGSLPLNGATYDPPRSSSPQPSEVPEGTERPSSRTPKGNSGG